MDQRCENLPRLKATYIGTGKTPISAIQSMLQPTTATYFSFQPYLHTPLLPLRYPSTLQTLTLFLIRFNARVSRLRPLRSAQFLQPHHCSHMLARLHEVQRRFSPPSPSSIFCIFS